MTESILKALMQLFAIITDIREEAVSGSARELVANYLQKQFDTELVYKYLALFEDYLAFHHAEILQNNLTKIQWIQKANKEKVIKICNELNEELEREPKLLVVIELLEFIKHKEYKISPDDLDLVDIVAQNLNIKEEDYQNLKPFVLYTIEKIPDRNNILILNNDLEFAHPEVKHIFVDKMSENVIVLYIYSTNTLIFKYIGQRNLYLNGYKVEIDRTYVLAPGSFIKTSRTRPVFYTNIAAKFFLAEIKSKVVFKAIDVEFKFPKTEDGIYKFNFESESGHLVGIMGGSGTGKTTLLNVFNGNLKLKGGKITINGFDLHEDKEQLKGIIGFVPQEDMLIEELTVAQNLYYNAKLCFASFSQRQLLEMVDRTLKDFDLTDAKDSTVGKPEKRIISGGQRKRLNIALELMREPAILFVDEPTSGLSSMDSEKVMSLLKRQTIKGKIVFINIHQPSSDFYKLLDHLIILDKGGRVVYNGNPINAIVYFKRKGNYVNPSESECPTCGNVKTEQPLRIIEARMVDPNGKLIRKRKVSPKEWYKMYVEDFDSKSSLPEVIEEDVKLPLPKMFFKIPSDFRQFKIYFIRNILSKLVNKQYLIISLLEAPVLALILSYFTKYIAGTPDDPGKYIFYENKNLPAYLFMSVIVSLFIGLVVSAEEIIRDRKIIRREKFLNLSRTSYLNSKILFVFLLSALQTLLYVLIGNMVLEIKDLGFHYWAILFTTSCFANMVGLNISSGLNTVVSIYITIPFILVPQLLLSGVVVNFNDLHQNLTSHKYVPFVGDFMASRWSFEALAVTQYKDNRFQKYFFEFDQKISEYAFKSNYIIPNLDSKIQNCKRNKIENINAEQTEKNLRILKNEIIKFKIILEDKIPSFSAIDSLTPEYFNEKTAKAASNHLELIKNYYDRNAIHNSLEKDNVYNQLVEKYGKEYIYQLKLKCDNQYLANYVLNRLDLVKIFETDNELIQLKDPIYLQPYSDYGRSHFYSAFKNIKGYKIDTMYFNMIVLWLMSFLLYLALLGNLLKRSVTWIENIRIRRPESFVWRRL